MIDYAQIAAQAEELSRQFWEEIEEELVRCSMAQPAASYPVRWQVELEIDDHRLDMLTQQSTTD